MMQATLLSYLQGTPPHPATPAGVSRGPARAPPPTLGPLGPRDLPGPTGQPLGPRGPVGSSSSSATADDPANELVEVEVEASACEKKKKA